MERDEALKLLQEHLPNPNLIKHSLAVEACMIAAARHFGADEALWGMTGLLHDLDYEYTLATPQEHTLKTEALLAPYALPAEIIHAIKAHNRRVAADSQMDKALICIDPASGFIIACALMHPAKKMAAIDLAFMKKRFKEKSFAKGASREQMAECAALGLALDDFLLLCLQALQSIAGTLGV